MVAPLGSLTEEHIDYHLGVNVKGVIWTVQKALPLMGLGGSIILNASIVASKGWANWSVYSASKAAVRNFARTWSSDLRGLAIDGGQRNRNRPIRRGSGARRRRRL
jgi:NAD(P)-dependent dehydrogenase (short-subunit alcohol dehydrogenase family)